MEYFVTRRAIFDQQENLKGYELLFREVSSNGTGSHNDYGTSQLFNYLLTNGFESVTRGKVALVNFTKKLLLDEVPTLFPTEFIKVGILDNITPEEDITIVLEKLKKTGYQLVFNSSVLAAGYEPFAELADIICVDFLNSPVEDMKAVLGDFHAKPYRFMAKNLRTRAEFNRAKELGFPLCHGCFLPVPIPKPCTISAASGSTSREFSGNLAGRRSTLTGWQKSCKRISAYPINC